MTKKDFNNLLAHETFLLRIAEAKRALNFIIFNEISKVPEDYFTDINYDDNCDMKDYIYKPSNPLKIQLDTVCLNIYFHKNNYPTNNVTNNEKSYFYSICIDDTPLYYIDYRVTDFGTTIENEELFDNEIAPYNLVFLNKIFSEYNYYNKGTLELNDLFNAFIKDDEDESEE